LKKKKNIKKKKKKKKKKKLIEFKILIKAAHKSILGKLIKLIAKLKKWVKYKIVDKRKLLQVK